MFQEQEYVFVEESLQASVNVCVALVGASEIPVQVNISIGTTNGMCTL